MVNRVAVANDHVRTAWPVAGTPLGLVQFTLRLAMWWLHGQWLGQSLGTDPHHANNLRGVHGQSQGCWSDTSSDGIRAIHHAVLAWSFADLRLTMQPSHGHS